MLPLSSPFDNFSCSFSLCAREESFLKIGDRSESVVWRGCPFRRFGVLFSEVFSRFRDETKLPRVSNLVSHPRFFELEALLRGARGPRRASECASGTSWLVLSLRGCRAREFSSWTFWLVQSLSGCRTQGSPRPSGLFGCCCVLVAGCKTWDGG